MTDDGPGLESLEDVSRRRFLAGAGGGVVGIGALRAVDNVFLGYGEFGNGTNLKEQDLRAVVTENLDPSYDERAAGVRLRLENGGVVAGSRRLQFGADGPEAARELDDELGLDGRLVELFVDARDLAAGEYTMAFSQPEAFFERVRAAGARPDLVAALRGGSDRRVDAETIRQFAGADPARPATLVEALVEGFREHASYDIPRYTAGSVEDNVLFGAADLREHFETDVSFEAINSREETGLFCWELVFRSKEALEAVGPWAQTIPVATCYVRDRRHKHAFTGIASAVREDGDLTVPMTFVDYTHSTLYDDLHLTPVLGRGLAAYDDRHRATAVFW